MIQSFIFRGLPKQALVRQTRENIRLELDSETHFSLSVYRHIRLRTLSDYLTKRAITGIGIRSLELRAVEKVKVIDLQNTLETLAEGEMLSHICGFIVQSRTTELWIISLCIAQDILRGSERKSSRIEHLRRTDLTCEVIFSTAIRCGAELDGWNAVRAQRYVWSRCGLSGIGIAVLLNSAIIATAQRLASFIIEDPANLPATQELTCPAAIIEVRLARTDW